MAVSCPNPEFLKDQGTPQNIWFALFVKALDENFVEIAPNAGKNLVELAQSMCEYSYQGDRLLGKRELKAQGLWVEPDQSQ